LERNESSGSNAAQQEVEGTTCAFGLSILNILSSALVCSCHCLF